MEAIFRRMRQIVGLARITATDDTQSAHQVQISFGDGQTRDKTSVMAIYGLHSHAPLHSDVVVLSIGGDRSNALVIGTGNQDARPRNTAPGVTGLHDDQGTSIMLYRDRIEINAGGRPINFMNGTVAHFTMPIVCDGEVTAKGIGLSTHHHDSGGPPKP